MLPISPAELASIQADAALAACDLTCVITRLVRTPESGGGATTAPQTIATVKAGMAEPTANQLANYGYLVGSLAAWLIKFPVATNVQELDHLLINGETLEVVKILRPRSYEALLTVLASEVK